MKEFTNTFIDLYPELLMNWRQESCSHIHIDYTKLETDDGTNFYAQGKCFNCGKEVGGIISWSLEKTFKEKLRGGE